jgi:ketosteroid isomerase-like protein
MKDMRQRCRTSRRSFSKALSAGALVLGLGPLLPFHVSGAWATPGQDYDQDSEGENTVTTQQDQGLAAVIEKVRLALAAMGSGDPQPYMDLWANRDDVTLFGAWGPIEKGHQQLMDTFGWVGSRFSEGALVPEDVVTHVSGDLAYTVGFERGDVRVDGGPLIPMTIRVTHLYRRIDGEWRLVHRHADFPPADQRQGNG